MRRISAYFASTVSLALLALASNDAFSAAISPALDTMLSYQFLRNDNGPPRAISLSETAAALKDYDVIFFGEWHDHAGNHLAEMELLQALQKATPNLGLSMEQFERDVQPVLDDYLGGKIGEEAMRRRGRAWGNYAESYRPLVEFAKDNGMAVIAANAPANVVRCVGQEGPEFLARMAPEKRNWAAAELHLNDGPYKDKFFHFLTQDAMHGGDSGTALTPANPSAASLRSFASQVTRDDTMAESIFLFLEKNPGHKVLHVTGAFHAEEFLGTVERLKLRAPNLKIAVIAPAEASNPKQPQLDPGDAKNGNFVLLLRPEPKDYIDDAEKKAEMSQMRGNFGAPRACNL